MTSTASAVDSSVQRLPDRAGADLPPAAQPLETRLVESRNEAIDVIRLIAAASIVFIHACKYSEFSNVGHLFRFAVPFYLFASLYFQTRSLQRNTHYTYFSYLLGRFKRLYLPFFAWSVIYLLLRDVKRVAIEHESTVPLTLNLLWQGSQYHLWFLPFLLCASVVLATIHWLVLRPNRNLRWPLISAAILGGFVFAFIQMPGWDEVFDNPTYAYVQYWRALPATFWAFAFAWFMAAGPVMYSVSRAVGFAGIALTVVCSVMQFFGGIMLIPRGLTGLGAMLAALAPWSGPAISALARLGRCSFGIYLSHVLIIEIIHSLAARSHFPQTALLDLLTFGLSFAASLGIAMMLSKSPRLVWLNG